MDGLGCDALLGLVSRENCGAFPCFFFQMKKFLCWIKTQILGLAWKLAPVLLFEIVQDGISDIYFPVKWSPSVRLGIISSFCSLSPPPSQPSRGWSVPLCSSGHSCCLEDPKHPPFLMNSLGLTSTPFTTQLSLPGMCTLGMPSTAESSKALVTHSLSGVFSVSMGSLESLKKFVCFPAIWHCPACGYYLLRGETELLIPQNTKGKSLSEISL